MACCRIFTSKLIGEFSSEEKSVADDDDEVGAVAQHNTPSATHNPRIVHAGNMDTWLDRHEKPQNIAEEFWGMGISGDGGGFGGGGTEEATSTSKVPIAWSHSRNESYTKGWGFNQQHTHTIHASKS